MTEQTPDSADERLREEQNNAAGASRWEAPAAGSLRPATDLAAASEQLLSGGARQLDSAALRDALLDLHDFWLTTKATEIGVTATSGFAIVATGGLGRGELLPYSDLDLTLLHDNMPHDIVGRVAELLWYPLWDANIRIDHSVRTVPEALKVAGEDISAGLAMLEARHIAGDSDLSSLLIGGARRQWRTGIASRFDELVEHTEARWQRSGQIAHRAEPDLKCGRGGLRDVQLLNALAIAQLADVYPSRSLASPTGTLGEAHLALLNVRTERWPPVRRRWPPSRRWTEPDYGAGCFPSGARCVTYLLATWCTSGPLTATLSKPSRGQARSPPGCPGPTCCCWVRCATILARVAAGGPAGSAPNWPPRTAPGGLWGRQTSTCCRAGCAIPCCCRTPRPAVICKTRRSSRRWSTRSTVTPCCSSCCTCWPRRTRLPPVPVCG